MKKLNVIKLSSPKLQEIDAFSMKSLYGGAYTLPEITVWPDKPAQTDGSEEIKYDAPGDY